MSQVWKKQTPGCSTTLVGKSSVDRCDKTWTFWQKCTTLCLEEKRHCTPTPKLHPNCEAWCREYHGLDQDASGPRCLAVIEQTMYSKLQDILQGPTLLAVSTSVESPEASSSEEILPEYQDLKEVFSKIMASGLSPHWPYDCVINLMASAMTSCKLIYPLSAKETQAVDNYIMEALKQGCIPSTTSPTSSGFFMEKKRGGLSPCNHYYRLNSGSHSKVRLYSSLGPHGSGTTQKGKNLYQPCPYPWGQWVKNGLSPVATLSSVSCHLDYLAFQHCFSASLMTSSGTCSAGTSSHTLMISWFIPYPKSVHNPCQKGSFLSSGKSTLCQRGEMRVSQDHNIIRRLNIQWWMNSFAQEQGHYDH